MLNLSSVMVGGLLTNQKKAREWRKKKASVRPKTEASLVAVWGHLHPWMEKTPNPYATGASRAAPCFGDALDAPFGIRTIRYR